MAPSEKQNKRHLICLVIFAMMLQTETTSHMLINEIYSPQEEINSPSKRGDIIRGHIDTAAPFESVKDAITKFGGIIEWEAQTALAIQEILKISSQGSPTSKITRAESLKKDVMDRGQIDTAAPFESVKEAIHKFGGVAVVEGQQALNIERQKSLHLELEKLHEEILKQKKEFEAAEATKHDVIDQLNHANRLVEELKLNLKKAETLEAQAKQESELVEGRLTEMAIEIGKSPNAALLTAAKEIVAAELRSVNQDLETIERAHAAMMDEGKISLKKAEDFVSAYRTVEKTIERLTLELGNTKKSLELAYSAQIEAEEEKFEIAADFELEKLRWEMELKPAADKLGKLNEYFLLTDDLRSKLDQASASLSDAKFELASYIEAREAHPKVKELEEVKSSIERAKAEVNTLRAAVSPLESTLELEKAAVSTMRERERLGSASVSALEAELESIRTEIEMVRRREKEAEERAADLSGALEQATEERNQAKLAEKSAGQELRKAEEEAELAKAEARTLEKRLEAALKEIQAAKASETLAISTAKAMKESKEQTSKEEPVTLSIEEYLELSKKAEAAEAIAKSRVTAAVERIREAKESESRRLQELEEVKRATQERESALRAATEEAEQAKEGQAIMEEELRLWKSKEGLEIRKASGVVRSLSGLSDLEEEAAAVCKSAQANADAITARSNTFNTVKDAKEPKRKKKSFFPRIAALFLSKKRIQALND
ncbi:hypothetical protein Cni_G02697 [Canna indica]|uniref:WEB family protein n=1 Tax=Canna indica TaxID=4628 RepID=A0AAQ3JQ51_9LILI|nr:hypothetical protein Cni_G02697 [Canna indica]